MSYFHAPWCRCINCPMQSDQYIYSMRYEKKQSPWVKFPIVEGAKYMLCDKSNTHFVFCRCHQCTYEPGVFRVCQWVIREMVKMLKMSPYECCEIGEPQRRPKLLAWKETMTRGGVEHIFKLKNNNWII